MKTQTSEQKKLTAYKIFLDNGTNYVTNMAAGVTLEMAEGYFLNNIISLNEEGKLNPKCIKVEKFD